MQLFAGSLSMDDFIAHILVTMATANTGIDKDSIKMVVQKGIPRDLIRLFQEQGQNARKLGMLGRYLIFTDWLMFVKLLLSILLPLEIETNEPPEYGGINSVGQSKTPVKHNCHNTYRSQPSCQLTVNQISDNIVQGNDDLIDLLYLYCLPDFGCIHCRSEFCMSRIPHLNVRLHTSAQKFRCG